MSFSKSIGRKSEQCFFICFLNYDFVPSTTFILTLSPSVIPTAYRISFGIVTCECLVTVTEAIFSHC